MFYTPNMENDGHDTDITFMGTYLSNVLYPKIQNLPVGTLTLITFDEDDTLGNNNVYATLLGDMIITGGSDDTLYNHYSQLQTVESNWNLPNLNTNDGTAANLLTMCLKLSTQVA